jgi:hypothetical protein
LLIGLVSPISCEFEPLSWRGVLMVINATFNNISVITWQSVLLVEETGGPGENHRHVASHLQTLSHNVVHQYWYMKFPNWQYSLGIFIFIIIQDICITHVFV